MEFYSIFGKHVCVHFNYINNKNRPIVLEYIILFTVLDMRDLILIYTHLISHLLSNNRI